MINYKKYLSRDLKREQAKDLSQIKGFFPSV